MTKLCFELSGHACNIVKGIPRVVVSFFLELARASAMRTFVINTPWKVLNCFELSS